MPHIHYSFARMHYAIDRFSQSFIPQTIRLVVGTCKYKYAPTVLCRMMTTYTGHRTRQDDRYTVTIYSIGACVYLRSYHIVVLPVVLVIRIHKLYHNIIIIDEIKC